MTAPAVIGAIVLALLLSVAPSRADAPEIRAEGVAGIGAATAFDLDALSRLFPDRPMEAGGWMTEGFEYPAIRLGARGGARVDPPAITVIGDEIGGRLGVSRVLLHAGLPIGRRFHDLLPDEASGTCEPGMEEESGTVFCPDPSAPNIRLRFAGAWDGPDGLLPPLAVLRNWTVDLLVWQPAPQPNP